MEPGIAAVAYGAETAIEGGVGAAIAVAKSTMPLKATWKRLVSSKPLSRSSHSLSVINGRAFIFGGEQKSGQPVDNEMHILTLPSSTVQAVDYKSIPAKAATANGNVPLPRLGHTASVIDDQIYIFGGRRGETMEALDEQGCVWKFDTKFGHWSALNPAEGSPRPKPRSYHASACTNHPILSSTEHAKGGHSESDLEGHGTLFIHAGCTNSGRLNDLWGFDVASRTWSKFPDAPGPARGGACLTLAQNRLYRMGGFDGQSELGGQIDYLEVSATTFDDKGGTGELAVVASTGQWETIQPASELPFPGNRSVAGLEPVTTGQGRMYLVLLLGERSPSSSGHADAGTFWDDVWSYQLRPDGMTAASFKDATRELFGVNTREGTWAQVDIPEATMTDGKRASPGELGWFASANGHDMDPGSIILWGGKRTDNQRASDGWILTIE
ncbi:MAG: hypothetical protein LQ342_003577 [Letrouitia transgressa]|nr:MAG: hypothetical protein LQ342_003577 [Letrouitia transgressa]